MAWTERYVRDDAAGGGDGTTDTNSGANGAWTLAEAISNSNAGHRLNVRAGTYANTTTARTFGTGAGAATTTAPKWWRGFNSTPGDIDSDNSLTKPLITFTTGALTFSDTHNLFTGLHFTSQRTAGSGALLGNNSSIVLAFRRCQFENTGTNAASSAAISNVGGGGHLIIDACWFKATSSATRTFDATRRTTARNCVFEGGGIGFDILGSLAYELESCVFNNLGSHGINVAGSLTPSLNIHRNTFYSCGGDGIRLGSLGGTTSYFSICDCIFSENSGYGINNNTGTNTGLVFRTNNLFYSNSSGTENGFGDYPSISEQTDSASPFTDAASGDLSLVSTSNAINKGSPAPGTFENQSYTGYLDIGAVQRQESGGGGSLNPFTSIYGKV